MAEATRPPALGRPVDPVHPLAAKFTIWSGSNRKPCSSCGRPTWFGPRTTAVVDAGSARGVCADCIITAHEAGDRHAAIVDLGNPEVKGPR